MSIIYSILIESFKKTHYHSRILLLILKTFITKTRQSSTMKKVFFACSMRGGFGDVTQEDLRKIPDIIESLGYELMSKHQVSATFDQDEAPLTEIEIHDRDYRWVLGCDYMIAEISNPSLGVGGEVSDACHLGKPVLCVYHDSVKDKVSAYIRGKSGSEYTPQLRSTSYRDMDDLKAKIDSFLKEDFA